MEMMIEEVKNEQVTLEEVTRSPEFTLRWCYDHEILQWEPNCLRCGSKTVMENDLLRIDLHRWRCSKRYSNLCMGTVSIRHDSFF